MSDRRSQRRLLVMIASDEAAFDELVTGMLDVGLHGGTIVQSKGLGAILRQDIPIFAGLAALLPHHTGSRMVFSLTDEKKIEAMKRFVEEMHPERRPLAIVLPVEQSFGLVDS